MSMDPFYYSLRTDHANEVKQGLHDKKCEWRDEGFFLCHCSKRRRIAAGVPEKLDELEFPPPKCPHCWENLNFADVWECPKCKGQWWEGGAFWQFADDYGDLDEQLAEWEASHGLRN